VDRSFVRLALAGLSTLAVTLLVVGCDRAESIGPDLNAQLGAVLVRDQAPAASPLPTPADVVTVGPGAACTTHRDGRTECTGANGSVARIAGLF
jgi:hypothetical protein